MNIDGHKRTLLDPRGPSLGRLQRCRPKRLDAAYCIKHQRLLEAASRPAPTL